MKTLSILTIVTTLGLAVAPSAFAQEYGTVPTPSDLTIQAPSLKGFSAVFDRDVRIDRQQNDQAWQGAGLGGNPNGN